MPFEIDVPNPPAPQPNQRVPVSRKCQLENYAEHAVVVILDLSFQPFPGFQNQWLNWLNHGRPLIANVSRGRMFKARLLQRPRPEDLPQLIELDLLTNIELDKHQHSSAQRRPGPLQFLVPEVEIRRPLLSNCEGSFIIPNHRAPLHSAHNYCYRFREL